MADDDDNIIQGNFGKPLEPPKTEETKAPSVNPANQLSETSANLMPTTLEVSAQSSINLRGIQTRLANFLTDESFLSYLAADKPEVLPGLLDSVTNAISTSDNLLIRMAQVAEKNASMNRVFEYLTKKDEQKQQQTSNTVEKDEWYDESVEKIKKAIYQKLDADRDAEHRKAQDYVMTNDDDDIIDVEIEESDTIEEDYDEEE